jgi:hypothetical protein
MMLFLLADCRPHDDPVAVSVVDLIREFDRAEKRPPAGFQIALYSAGGIAYPAILAPVPSRLTCALPLPRRGMFHAYVALADPPPGASASPARIRIGISDDRVYEGLTEAILTPGARRWIDIRADLSGYAGWKWSLFYRPDQVTTWRLVLAADSMGGAPATAVWGLPEVLTDTQSAREYAARRQRVR